MQWYHNLRDPWRMVYSGMLRRVAVVRSDVSEELSASFIRVTRIGEPGTTLAVTNNRPNHLVFLRSVRRLLVTASVVPDHRFLSPWWRRRYVPLKFRFLKEPHGVTSQKTPFFIVTAVETSILHWGALVIHQATAVNKIMSQLLNDLLFNL
jgi:hypothetical protein